MKEESQHPNNNHNTQPTKKRVESYLERLDQNIFSIKPSAPFSTESNTNILLISYAMKLLNSKNKRIEKTAGGILELLEHNSIYSRKVGLPSNIKKGEYPLLLLLDCKDSRPYLLVRKRNQNALITAEHGLIIDVQDNQWPAFKTTCFELHRSFRGGLNNIIEIIKLTYEPEIASINILLVVSLVVLIFSLSIPILTNTLVSIVLPESNLNFLIESLTIVILIVIASIVSQYLQEIIILRLETIGNQRLQIAIWAHFLKLPTTFAATLTRGEVYVGVTSIATIRQYLGAGALKSVLSALFSFAFLGLMFNYNSNLSIWMIVFILATLCIVGLMARKAIQLNKTVFNIRGRISAMSYELANNFLSIRSLGAEVSLLKRWMDRNTKLADNSLQLNMLEQSIDVILKSISRIGSVILFAVAVSQILSQPARSADPALIGSFIAFYTAFLAFSASIADAAANLTEIFANIFVLWDNAKIIFSAEIEPGWQATVPNQIINGAISFRQVNVQLTGMIKPLLNNLNIEIPNGAMISVCGKKASGKTLLLKTILGLTPLKSGEILINLTPLKQLSARGYRRQVGYLPQNIVLEPIDLRQLLSDNRQVSDEEIWSILEKTGVDTAIKALPLELDTELTKDGRPLSFVQKKLIALTRALLRRPAILLLDEFLVGIPENQHKRLLDLIRKQGCTVVMITTTEEELNAADHALLIDRGGLRPVNQAKDAILDQIKRDWS